MQRLIRYLMLALAIFGLVVNLLGLYFLIAATIRMLI
jgi:hypothetical protein